MSYCIQCGGKLSDGANFCSFCRAPIQISSAQGGQATQNDGPFEGAPVKHDVLQCASCGASLTTGKSFCSFCGAQVQSGDVNDGAPVQNGNINAGAPVQSGDVRCIRCGAIIPGTRQFCGCCGQPALSKRDYDSMAARYYKADEIKKKNNRGVTILLVFVLITVIIFSIINSNAQTDTPMLFGEIPLHVGLLITLLIIGAISIPALIAGRSSRYKKARMTAAQYRQLIKQYKALPKEFLYPVSGYNLQYVGHGRRIPLDRKTIRKQRLLAVGALIVTLCLAGWGFSLLFGGGSGGLGALGGEKDYGTLSDRWEGQVIPYTTDTNGVTLEQIDSIAIVFRGNRAYFGSSLNNDADIIAENEAWDYPVTTYKLGDDTITFITEGKGSETYQFDGKIIYMGDYEIRQVS